jgi:hypothetical protein
MMNPVDTTTGAQCGSEVKGTTWVIEGWLVTLPDGHKCRLGPDETRARNYGVQQRAVRVEPMYVLR